MIRLYAVLLSFAITLTSASATADDYWDAYTASNPSPLTPMLATSGGVEVSWPDCGEYCVMEIWRNGAILTRALEPPVLDPAGIATDIYTGYILSTRTHVHRSAILPGVSVDSQSASGGFALGTPIELPSSFDRHGYATRTAFSADTPPALLYDANDGDITTLTGSNIGSAPFTTESHFLDDPANPNMMCGVKGGLTSYGCQLAVGGSYTEYYSPPSGFLVRLGPGEGETEINAAGDRCVVLYEYNGSVNSGTERMISLDMSTAPATVLGTLDISGRNMDKATVSKNCEYVLAVYRSTGITSYTKDLNNELLLDNNNDSHADVFETPDGQQWVYSLGSAPHEMFNLATGQQITIAGTSDLRGGHVSAAARCAGLVAWSPNRDGDNTDMRLFKIGNAGAILADHNLGPADSSSDSYSSQPLLTISPSGTHAIYSSDQTGSDRDYVLPLGNPCS